MPFYYTIDNRVESERRIASGLLRLKDSFVQEPFPPRSISDTLLLATWNIREFDSAKYGMRGKEPIFYIAEIISNFDLVAVQEVREDLTALNLLMRTLGGWWKCLLTDVTRGVQGNGERMVFLYDSRKISFGGLASGVVIPPIQKRGQEFQPARQLVRTPFLVGFQAGWFKFTICTAHILYGEDDPEEPQRLEEIRMLAEFLAERADDKYAWARNMVLLGDFNIYDTTDATLKAIEQAGFTVPPQLQKLPTNIPQTKHYDQIAFIAPDIRSQLELCRAGVYNFFKHVYRKEDEPVYAAEMGQSYLQTKEGKPRDDRAKTRYYNDWRTFQVSDHLPMWIELKVDFGREYLAKKAQPPANP